MRAHTLRVISLTVKRCVNKRGNYPNCHAARADFKTKPDILCLKQVAIAGTSFPVVVFSTWFEAAI